MNDNLNQEQFDKLVDGGLSETERRELLANLDQQPEGWRRCALAFLQAQCWRESLRAMEIAPPASPHATAPGQAERVAAAAEAVPAAKSLPARSRWPARLQTAAAMAASFLVVLWVGTLMQRAWRDESIPGTKAQIAQQMPSGTSNGARDGRELATNREGTSPNPWQVVTVSSPANGRSMNLPAVERNRLDDQWLRSVGPAVPDHVVQALNHSGHAVEQHRELVPVPLPDGRRLVVPVDQVDVRYVGNQTY